MVETTLVPFHEDVLEAVYAPETQTISVVCKRMAENLGTDWPSQYLVLRGHAVLSKYLLSCDITIEGIGTRETILLPLKYLPSWLLWYGRTIHERTPASGWSRRPCLRR